MYKYLVTLSTALWTLAAGSALAQVEWDLAGGASFPSASNYESDVFANTSLGYGGGNWVGRAGYLFVGEFELESDLASARITMRGPYVQAVRRFNTRILDWELGLGAAQLESEAVLGGRVLEKQTEWDAFLELALTKKMTDGLFLKGSYYYFNDRLGSDVSSLAVGIRFSF